MPSGGTPPQTPALPKTTTDARKKLRNEIRRRLKAGHSTTDAIAGGINGIRLPQSGAAKPSGKVVAPARAPMANRRVGGNRSVKPHPRVEITHTKRIF